MSGITLFGILVDDPEPVFVWLSENVADYVVRKMAYKTVLGWHLKIALEGEDAKTAFLAKWSGDLWQTQLDRRKRALPGTSFSLLDE